MNSKISKIGHVNQILSFAPGGEASICCQSMQMFWERALTTVIFVTVPEVSVLRSSAIAYRKPGAAFDCL